MAEKEKKPKTALDELEELQNAQAELLARIQVDAAKSGSSGYTLPLHEPIIVGPETRYELKFRSQNLKDIRDSKGDDELTALLCEISVEQLKQLSAIDYACTQEVLAGFHLRRAVSGPARKG